MLGGLSAAPAVGAVAVSIMTWLQHWAVLPDSATALLALLLLQPKLLQQGSHCCCVLMLLLPLLPLLLLLLLFLCLLYDAHQAAAVNTDDGVVLCLGVVHGGSGGDAAAETLSICCVQVCVTTSGLWDKRAAVEGRGGEVGVMATESMSACITGVDLAMCVVERMMT